jgi:hypothetical protein
MFFSSEIYPPRPDGAHCSSRGHCARRIFLNSYPPVCARANREGQCNAVATILGPAYHLRICLIHVIAPIGALALAKVLCESNFARPDYVLVGRRRRRLCYLTIEVNVLSCACLALWRRLRSRPAARRWTNSRRRAASLIFTRDLRVAIVRACPNPRRPLMTATPTTFVTTLPRMPARRGDHLLP